MQITLAHVLVSHEGFLADHTDLLYRAQGRAAVETPEVDTPTLTFEGTVDFLTYFNALPLAKWRQYAAISNVALELEASGSFSMSWAYVYAPNSSDVEDPPVTTVAVDVDQCTIASSEHAEYQTYTVPLPIDDAVLVGFVLTAANTVHLRSARFVTDVEPAAVNTVRLALATTTFNNEDYILPNIQAIQRSILESDEPIAQAFHLFVVDNGQTLDAETLQRTGVAVGAADEYGRMHANGITVCPNPNVGGAGGFARGMLEALDWVDQDAKTPDDTSDSAYTHVLLMDDDVTISPESIKRTFSLLQLAQGKYQDAFVNGAMLKRSEPNIQFEDVSFARSTGGYERFKPTLDVSKLSDMVRNETIAVEGPGAYGAWWFSCIPASAIREHGLPMPYFVRGDDVEYGVRCQGTYMTMSGICVWHDHFVGRFRASVDGYQYARNLMSMAAIHDSISLPTFMMRFWRVFHIYLRTINYDAASLWLDALEDYLRGPDWLAEVDGAALMKANGAKNEKLVPLDELDQEVLSKIEIDYDVLGHDEPPRSALAKLFESLPHDRHWFPVSMLRSEPGIIDYSGNLGPWQNIAMRRTLVALDATGEHGHIRTVDKVRYKQLMQRYKQLQHTYRTQGKQIQQDWKDAFPYLTSVGYWKNHLGLVPTDGDTRYVTNAKAANE